MRDSFSATLGLCLLLLTIFGCTPSQIKPAKPDALDWKAAQPLDGLTKGTVEPWFKLSLEDAADPIYFAELNGETADSGLREPLIVRKINGRWMALNVGNEWSGNGWMHASVGPAKGEIWAMLDHLEEDSGWDLVLLHSTDAGISWKMSALHKVCYFAGFARFAMGSSGHGVITVRLGDDYTDQIKAGDYQYRTIDGGTVWFDPEFEPDATTPAQRCKGDETIGVVDVKR